jgi:hypothetical protein
MGAVVAWCRWWRHGDGRSNIVVTSGREERQAHLQRQKKKSEADGSANQHHAN